MASLISWLSSHSACKVNRCARLAVESLELRTVPAVVTVSNGKDDVNGTTTSIAALITAPGPDGISLREAITAANNTANVNNQPDEIRFDIGNAEQVITVAGTGLPAVTDALIINAAEKPVGKPNQVIVLDGTGLPAGTHGLRLTTGGATSATGSRIWGLTVQEFTGDGIQLVSVSDVNVGGSGEGQGNIMLSNMSNGILVQSTNNVPATNNHIVGNLIGTPNLVFEALTSVRGNEVGVRLVNAHGNFVGGN